MFYDEIQKIDWDETTQKIMSKTDADVRRALAKKHLSVDDFMALVSPAADKYLEPMAHISRRITRERFGNTINMFIPIYITNSCANSCVYCGFHVQNKMPRTILTEEEIVKEYEAIKKLGPFDNLLVLTGENPAKAGVPYIARALDLAKPYFNNLQIEVMPLDTQDYAELRKHGLNGVICFQETYHEARYKVYHPRGPKSDYKWRLNGYDRMGMAGVHKIGMGALIGLEDWRTEVVMMAYHLRYLEKTYWKTQFSVNFPRMRVAENGGFQPNCEMTDRELAQVTFAMRIFDHDVDISYSTRENPEVRNHMATLGVTTMSAESHTDPGGYSTHPEALEQFHVSDERTAKQVDADLRAIGMEPVWKNWDASFDRVKMGENQYDSQLAIRMRMSFQYITHQNERYSYLEGALKALEGGCRWIQLRMKDATDEEFKQVALPLSKACKEHGAILVLDDRVNLVKEVGAQGVHLGKEDMSPSEARGILGDHYIIGGTANTIDDVERLSEEGVTYIGCGPFRFTTTKKKLAPVLGVEGYKALHEQMRERQLNVPFVAIGGVTYDDIEALMLEGHANGVAVSGAILNADDPVEMTRKMLKMTRETFKINRNERRQQH